MIECAWAFPPEALEATGFDPSYAVDFWDLTNHQDREICESVQRGLSSAHAQPGPLSPDEDESVYQLRDYGGTRIPWPADLAAWNEAGRRLAA